MTQRLSPAQARALAHDLEVRIAALSERAVVPQKAHAEDAGFDLAIPSHHEIQACTYGLIDLEFALQIPPGWYGQIFGRSSVFRRGFAVHPGVVDADYRGPIQLLVYNQSPTPQRLERGERLAQLLFLPVPNVTLIQVDAEALSRTARGAGGFGSTGR